VSMKRILFVDDEPAILAGIGLLLRRERRRWELVFAENGQAALGKLSQGDFDVIVSDMRMPGMDGATLLRRVRDAYPNVVRIILSGHAEREALMRAMPVCHQFLSKPCDAETVRTVIERACTLQDLLENAQLRQLVGKVEKLPSAPQLYAELTRAMASPDVSVSAVARIVERDPAMCAKLLQVVSSSYFGTVEKITAVEPAIMFLGLELVRSLVMTAHIFGAAPDAGEGTTAIQRHSLVTAVVAKRLLGDTPQAEEAFTAALLHDIGKIILTHGVPKRSAELARAARAAGVPMHVKEVDVLGVSHAAIGAYLVGLWGLPLPIVEGVAYHHAPRRAGRRDLDAIGAVHVADALVSSTLHSPHDDHPPAMLDLEFVASIGCTSELPRWMAIAREVVARHAGGEEAA
jgi:putative nucleotidyltransferase with HDIG domain